MGLWLSAFQTIWMLGGSPQHSFISVSRRGTRRRFEAQGNLHVTSPARKVQWIDVLHTPAWARSKRKSEVRAAQLQWGSGVLERGAGPRGPQRPDSEAQPTRRSRPPRRSLLAEPQRQASPEQTCARPPGLEGHRCAVSAASVPLARRCCPPEVRCFMQPAWGGTEVEPVTLVLPRPGRNPLRFVPLGQAGRCWVRGPGTRNLVGERGAGRCVVGRGSCCVGGDFAQECSLGLFKV